MQIEVIEWLDSAGVEGMWNSDDATRKLRPYKFLTVGRVINEGTDFVTIAASWPLGDEIGPFSGVTSIPKPAILSRRTITLQRVVKASAKPGTVSKAKVRKAVKPKKKV